MTANKCSFRDLLIDIQANGFHFRLEYIEITWILHIFAENGPIFWSSRAISLTGDTMFYKRY